MPQLRQYKHTVHNRSGWWAQVKQKFYGPAQKNELGAAKIAARILKVPVQQLQKKADATRGVSSYK